MPLYLLAMATLLAPIAASASLPRIQVVGTSFRAESGEAVWLNGINTAWIGWNDFGGGRFDRQRWEAEFARYAAAGINCARVWLDCDGEIAVEFDPTGEVVGPAAGFLDDVEALLQLAEVHGVRVLAVLTSFDHVKPTHPKHPLWRRVFNDDARLETYLARFVEPLARRFSQHPALFAWEICNEPEWIWFNRYGVSRERVVAFHARMAVTLHRSGPKPVTTGSASWCWHGDRRRSGRSASHPWSDASLAGYSRDPGARLDFYQVHYYDWMAPLGWNPFDRGASPGRFLKVVDRPVIVGETRGRYSWWTRRTVEDTYVRGAANGYAGVFGWSAHGQDGHGNFAEIAVATRHMATRIGLGRGPVASPALVAATLAAGGEGRSVALLPVDGRDAESTAVQRVAQADFELLDDSPSADAMAEDVGLMRDETS